MERDIIHINISAFPIGVERVVDSALRERPVVVALPSPRAVALVVSREAYLDGIRKGMAVEKAKKFCRGLVVVPPNPPLYRRAERAVEKIAADFSPLVEPGRQGHLHLDLTGNRRLFGHPLDAAARLNAEIRSRLRLRNTVGLAANKLVSRAASRVIRPRGVCDVFAGNEADFLAPLDLEVLPGIGVKTAIRLADFNLHRVGQIAALDPTHLFIAFGKHGLKIHQHARGIDPSPVRPPDRAPAITEELTLPGDSNDDAVIGAALLTIVERAGQKLRALPGRARILQVEIAYADRLAVARKLKLPYPSDQHASLLATATQLLEQTWTRRIRLTWIALTLSDLHQGPRQLELFPQTPEPQNIRDQRITTALEQIRSRFGEAVISRGRST